MPASRAVIEALTGAPLTRSAQFAAAGLDPAGTAPIREKAAIRRAKEKAHSAGGMKVTERISTGLANAGATLTATGNPYAAALAGAEGAVRDPKNDPDVVRAARLTQITGPTAEQATQQREELLGEPAPGYMGSALNVAGMYPGRSPMVKDTGDFDARAAGVNAISASLGALGGAMVGPAATAGGIAGSKGAGVLADEHAKNPYVNIGAKAVGGAVGGSVAGGLFDPEIPDSVFPGSEALRTTLKFPGSLVPEGAREAIGGVGRSTLDALPTAASTSTDVLRSLAAQRRGRFRALLAGMNATPSAPVSDPFGNLETPALPGTERLL